MGSAKVALAMDEGLLSMVDRWVAEECYQNRSKALHAAVREKLGRARRKRLAEKAGKQDPNEERALAEEGFAAE